MKLAGPLPCLFACPLPRVARASVSRVIFGERSLIARMRSLPKLLSGPDPQTGLDRTVASDASGHFRLTGLLPGPYDINARLPGFAAWIRKGVTVHLLRWSMTANRLGLA